MGVSQAYVSKLEHSEDVSENALEHVRRVLEIGPLESVGNHEPQIETSTNVMSSS